VSGPEADHGFWIQTTEREQELRKCREDEKGRKIWAVSNLRNCSLLVYVRVPFQGSEALHFVVRTNVKVRHCLFSVKQPGVKCLDIKSIGHVIHTH
jgi:hypothetical protein